MARVRARSGAGRWVRGRSGPARVAQLVSALGPALVRAVAGGVPEGGAVVAARRADEHLQRGGGCEHVLPLSHRVPDVVRDDSLAELAREPGEGRAVRRARWTGAELRARGVAVVPGRPKRGVQVSDAPEELLAGQVGRSGELLAGVPYRPDDGGEGHVARAVRKTTILGARGFECEPAPSRTQGTALARCEPRRIIFLVVKRLSG